jgi:hypothetical protein
MGNRPAGLSVAGSSRRGAGGAGTSLAWALRVRLVVRWGRNACARRVVIYRQEGHRQQIGATPPATPALKRTEFFPEHDV